MATVIPYEPLCCGSIEDPGSFPVCEEIWNNSNGQLDQFFTKTMKSGGLNSTWVDSYLQDNWIDHNNCLQSRMRHPSTGKAGFKDGVWPGTRQPDPPHP